MSIISNSVKKGPYFAKDVKKFRQCNKLISRGSASSSSEADRKAAGAAANCGEYTASDIVGISVEGARKGRIGIDVKEFALALKARATIVKDADADVDRAYNVGERQAQVILAFSGYMQVKPGIWEPSDGFKPNASKERQEWVWAAIKKVVAEDKEAQSRRYIKWNEDRTVGITKETAKDLRCHHCEGGTLAFVEENQPWSADHYQCEQCDSTYPDFVIKGLDVEASPESLKKLRGE